MRFTPTSLKGAFIIEPEPHQDHRGHFARTWCRRELEEHGLEPRLVQCSESFNLKKGTLRGMHYQAAPHAETKLVRALTGSIFDVIIDLRPHSHVSAASDRNPERPEQTDAIRPGGLRARFSDARGQHVRVLSDV
jgi:dTDP-4-dehydrorhamnose 3,5-epimerase-like enzyme